MKNEKGITCYNKNNIAMGALIYFGAIKGDAHIMRVTGFFISVEFIIALIYHLIYGPPTTNFITALSEIDFLVACIFAGGLVYGEHIVYAIMKILSGALLSVYAMQLDDHR